MDRRGFLGRIGKLGAEGAAIAAVGLPVLETDPPPALVGEAGPTLVSLPELGPTFQEIRAMVPEAHLDENYLWYIRSSLRALGSSRFYFKQIIDQSLENGQRLLVGMEPLSGLEPLRARITLSAQTLFWDGTTLTRGAEK